MIQNVIIAGGREYDMVISQVIKSQNKLYFKPGKCDLQGVTDKKLCVLYILASLAEEIWLVKATEGKEI